MEFGLDGGLGYEGLHGTGDLNYKVGVGGRSDPPAVSAGYYPLARVSVPAGATSIADGDIRDMRHVALGAYGIGTAAFTLSLSAGIPPSASINVVLAPPGVRVAAHGNRLAAGTGFVYLLGGQVINTVTMDGHMVAGLSRSTLHVERFSSQSSDERGAVLRADEVTDLADATLTANSARQRFLAGSPRARAAVVFSDDAGVPAGGAANCILMFKYV